MICVIVVGCWCCLCRFSDELLGLLMGCSCVVSRLCNFGLPGVSLLWSWFTGCGLLNYRRLGCVGCRFMGWLLRAGSF